MSSYSIRNLLLEPVLSLAIAGADPANPAETAPVDNAQTTFKLALAGVAKI